MLQSLSSGRRRLLALGILLIAILLVAAILVEPYVLALNKSVDHVDSLAFQVRQNTKAIRKQEYYSDEINRLGNAHSEDEIYLRSEKIALATAEIQQILKTIAGRSGSELLSSQPILGEQADQGRVGVQLRARANIFGLRKLLHGLEAGIPRLFINEITINRGSRAVFRFNDTESTNEILDVQMLVFGYIKRTKKAENES